MLCVFVMYVYCVIRPYYTHLKNEKYIHSNKRGNGLIFVIGAKAAKTARTAKTLKTLKMSKRSGKSEQCGKSHVVTFNAVYDRVDAQLAAFSMPRNVTRAVANRAYIKQRSDSCFEHSANAPKYKQRFLRGRS